MNKKFIIRSLAATAVSLAAKLIVKKIQEKSRDTTADAKNSENEEKPAIDAPETSAYSPHATAI